MLKLLINLFVFLVVPFAQANQNQLDKFQVHSGIHLDIVEAQDLKARVFGYEIAVDLEDKIHPKVNLFFKAAAILEKGSNEVVAGLSEFAPTESLNLESGGVEYRPFSQLTLRAGALNQSELNSPLLVGSSAFTAFEQTLKFGLFYLRAQQAIPNNNRLSEKIGETLDSGTPYFGTETIGFNFKSKNSLLKVEFSQFTYKDLSSEIAEKSNLIGNSVIGSGVGTEFQYGFKGTNAVFEAKRHFSWFQISFLGQYLYNDKAPDKRNKGQLAQITLGSKKHSFLLESFRNESDSAPAFYNSKYYGHNNYTGSAFGYEMRLESLVLSLKYYDLNLIEESSTQENTDIFNFNLAKTYNF